MDKNTEEHLKTVQEQLKLSLETTQEFFDMWTKSYQSTFGKLARVPAFGPIREKQEKIIKGIPIYTNLYTTWVESSINFQNVFMEAMKITYEKIMDNTKMEKECISPEKYKEFYKIWIDTYSETFKEFMKSGHFSSDAGKFMSTFMDFQKYNRDTVEENFLKPSNLPTKTEINEINKELYDLKKTVKELTKELKELSKDIKDQKELPKENKPLEKSELVKKVESPKKSEQPNKKEATTK